MSFNNELKILFSLINVSFTKRIIVICLCTNIIIKKRELKVQKLNKQTKNNDKKSIRTNR